MPNSGFFNEDDTCKECLPPHHCWRARLGIEPATLSSAGQRSTSRAAEVGLLRNVQKRNLTRNPKSSGRLLQDYFLTSRITMVETAVQFIYNLPRVLSIYVSLFSLGYTTAEKLSIPRMLATHFSTAARIPRAIGNRTGARETIFDLKSILFLYF